jgi:hypothetical protein
MQYRKQGQIFLISLVFTVSFSWFSLASDRVTSDRVTTTAPLFEAMGNRHRPITTKSSQARTYLINCISSNSHY